MTQEERAEDIKTAIVRIEAELDVMKQYADNYDTGDYIAMMAKRTPDLKTFVTCLNYQCRRYVEIDRAGDKRND